MDYMVWKDQVNVLDQHRIFRLLAKGPRLEGYLSQLRKAERLDFASWGGFAQNFAERRIPFEHSSVAELCQKAGRESLFVPTFNAGPSGPYLPGSALKGAVRTPLLFTRLTEGMLTGVAQRLEGERVSYRPAQTVEDQVIGDARRSRLKALSISDSATIDAKSMKVYLVRTATLRAKDARNFELGWKMSQHGAVEARRVDDSAPVFAEMAVAGTEFEGEWKEPAFSRGAEILRDLHWKEAPGYKQIFDAANKYSTRLLELQREFAARSGLEAVGSAIAELQGRLGEVSASGDACVLPLGWGGGYLSKSVAVETAQESVRSILRMMPYYARAVQTGLPFPKTRRIVFLQGKPATLPGWVYLSLS
jgi:CRISPR-associated protein Csm5